METELRTNPEHASLLTLLLPSICPLQSEMGLATEQLSRQLLDYEKKVSMGTMIKGIISAGDGSDMSPSHQKTNRDTPVSIIIFI